MPVDVGIEQWVILGWKTPRASGSQSVVLRPAPSASLGSMLEMRICRQAKESVLLRPPGDYYA